MINILDEALINKIAAGEVIDRPMNVIKELVENAVDARAQRITIEMTNTLIKISDDGVGIPKEDMDKSIIRHATSKIKEFDDLEKVKSLGFRGEALASIAAVSNLTITSKYKEELEGYQLEVEAGKIKNFKTVGCSKGTTIEVRDLFFNTPVRKKFLDHKENERIVGWLEKFSLGTIVGIKLIINGKTLLDVNSLDIKDRIAQVYGSQIANEMIQVDYETDNIRVRGFAAKPTQLMKDRSKQVIFVNTRLIESDEVKSAIYDAYKSILFVNKHPIVVLSMKVEGVDVNVHPTKKIVKFSDPDSIYDAVFQSIRSVFKTETVIFEAQDKFMPQGETTLAQLQERYLKKQKEEEITQKQQQRFTPETQKGLVETSENDGYKRLPKFRIIGPVAKTFFLAEGEEGLLLIDQHVVEERINYEKFMKQFMTQEVEIQELLNPILLDLTQRERIQAKRATEILKEFGYTLEEFGEDTFRLTTVPVIFNKVKGQDFLKNILVDFKDEEKEKTITMMACRNAIKAGDDITVDHMKKLLKQLDKCDLPFTCPHGRPTFVKLTLEDLEKLFRRKGYVAHSCK
jgi:DNA mismatch repair protein MutL